jgi:hypothetical protein
MGVCVRDVAALMTRTGAWAALFSSPPDGTGGATLALVADAVAHTRPGPVLYQPLLTSDHIAAMRLSYAFLFSPTPLGAPRLNDGFLYCQPTFVAAHAGLQIPGVLKATNKNAALVEERASELPHWAMAVQRHVESLALEELRRNSPDVLLSTSESTCVQFDPTKCAAKSEGVEKTLGEIQKIVSDCLQKSRQ